MAAQLHIVVRNMAHPQGFDSKVRGMLDRLEKICPRITAFHLTLGEENHQHGGGRFCLKLDVRAPRIEIVVTRGYQEDVYIALREACQAARRQLIEHMERGQGAKNVRHSNQQVAAVEDE
jgi:ribosome-associated translation inhibitor RaiA